MIEEKEKDGISSPSSLVASEEEEISSSRRPTLARHHTVALGSALASVDAATASSRATGVVPRGGPSTAVVFDRGGVFVSTAAPGALAARHPRAPCLPLSALPCAVAGFDRGADPRQPWRGKVRHDAANLVLCNLVAMSF